MAYVEAELWLERDTLLVIATDGFGDAHMSELDPLGLAGLMRSIDRGPREPESLCSFLFEAAGRRGFKDDATVVAMNICLGKPGAARGRAGAGLSRCRRRHEGCIPCP